MFCSLLFSNTVIATLRLLRRTSAGSCFFKLEYGYLYSGIKRAIHTKIHPRVRHVGYNGNGTQIIAHASLADVPVSNLKDLDPNQGDTITNAVVNICMTYNVFGVTFFA